MIEFTKKGIVVHDTISSFYNIRYYKFNVDESSRIINIICRTNDKCVNTVIY